MQDLSHEFTAKPRSAKTEAAFASIEAKRQEKVRQGYAAFAPYAGINPRSRVVDIARFIVLATLFIAPNYLLYMHVWGGN